MVQCRNVGETAPANGRVFRPKRIARASVEGVMGIPKEYVDGFLKQLLQDVLDGVVASIEFERGTHMKTGAYSDTVLYTEPDVLDYDGSVTYTIRIVGVKRHDV